MLAWPKRGCHERASFAKSGPSRTPASALVIWRAHRLPALRLPFESIAHLGISQAYLHWVGLDWSACYCLLIHIAPKILPQSPAARDPWLQIGRSCKRAKDADDERYQVCLVNPYSPNSSSHLLSSFPSPPFSPASYSFLSVKIKKLKIKSRLRKTSADRREANPAYVVIARQSVITATGYSYRSENLEDR